MYMYSCSTMVYIMYIRDEKEFGNLVNFNCVLEAPIHVAYMYMRTCEIS